MSDEGITEKSKTPEEYFVETGKNTEPPKLKFKEQTPYAIKS